MVPKPPGALTPSHAHTVEEVEAYALRKRGWPVCVVSALNATPRPALSCIFAVRCPIRLVGVGLGWTTLATFCRTFASREETSSRLRPAGTPSKLTGEARVCSLKSRVPGSLPRHWTGVMGAGRRRGIRPAHPWQSGSPLEFGRVGPGTCPCCYFSSLPAAARAKRAPAGRSRLPPSGGPRSLCSA